MGHGCLEILESHTGIGSPKDGFGIDFNKNFFKPSAQQEVCERNRPGLSRTGVHSQLANGA